MRIVTMTDLEMTKLCAEAMGFGIASHTLAPHCPWPTGIRVYEGKKARHWYSPLYDDAQAMALVKKLRLCIEPEVDFWWAHELGEDKAWSAGSTPNRAIVECVAKLQETKTGTDVATT